MTSATDVHKMMETSLKETLYLALQYPTASEQEMMDHIADHLRYMEAHEDKAVAMSGVHGSAVLG